VPPGDLCVYCRQQPVDPRWQPFCSERCQLLDLAHWFDGDYRVAGPVDGTPPDMEPDDPEATDDL
jgi:endogenous inhibitor of DNA gyrase (YacG/DUF329 family)